MSVYQRSSERQRIIEEYQMRQKEIAAAIGRQRPMSPKSQLEQEKRIRREIANSNERRRMQSINSGFQSLKALLPQHEGEKLSKAGILHQTTDYLHNLEQEKTKLLAQNAHLKRMLSELTKERDEALYNSPPPKRKKRDTESSDEGITADYYDELGIQELRREMIELRCQLDRERRLRMMLEDQTRSLESKLYPEHLRHIASQVQAQMQLQKEKMIGKEDVQEGNQTSSDSESAGEPSLRSSMSRRNLETIVEAIRHLEGDRLAFEDHKNELPKAIPHSEESEKENSFTSDQDDVKSDSDGRDLPALYSTSDCPVSYVTNTSHQPTTIHLQRTVSQTYERYPIATNLLHRPIAAQYFYRPGVIVHKS